MLLLPSTTSYYFSLFFFNLPVLAAAPDSYQLFLTPEYYTPSARDYLNCYQYLMSFNYQHYQQPINSPIGYLSFYIIILYFRFHLFKVYCCSSHYSRNISFLFFYNLFKSPVLAAAPDNPLPIIFLTSYIKLTLHITNNFLLVTYMYIPFFLFYVLLICNTRNFPAIISYVYQHLFLIVFVIF